MSVRTLPSPGSRMSAATSVAIAVATYPAAGVDSRCAHPATGGVDEALVLCAGASLAVAGSRSRGALVSSSAVGACSRRSLASSIVSLCAFAVSIASESSGPIVLKGVWRTFALALGENVQLDTLENYSLFWL